MLPNKKVSKEVGQGEALSCYLPIPKPPSPLDLLPARIFVSAGLGFGILLVRRLWGGLWL